MHVSSEFKINLNIKNDKESLGFHSNACKNGHLKAAKPIHKKSAEHDIEMITYTSEWLYHNRKRLTAFQLVC